MTDHEPPIQNLDSFDIVGKRGDGGIDLVIVCSGPVDDSADTLRRCVFHPMPVADFTACRSPISRHAGRSFHVMPVALEG
jgi:hypothetical protein